jgi:hypothetical protein
VDDKRAPRNGTLQKYDIVKLIKFSPVVFELIHQSLAPAC